MRADQGVVLAAVQNNGWALQHANPDLRNNLEVVLVAVQKDGMALECASPELRADREVVMAAVQNNGLALQHASEELRRNERVVLEAVKQNPFAILYQTAVIGFETEQDRSIHRDAFKRQAKILLTLSKGSAEYLKLATCHLEHFKQLSEHGIDCTSDMFIGLKKAPPFIAYILSRNDIPELNKFLLDCFQKNTELAILTKNSFTKKQRKVFDMASLYHFKSDSLLKDLQNVKNKLHYLSPEKEEKCNNFISFLKAQGLVKDYDLLNLVFTTKNNPSQSVSSSSAGVATEPQSIVTEAGARVVGDPARVTEAASSSGGGRR